MSQGKSFVVELFRDETAEDYLDSDIFCDKWQMLHATCTWATSMQSISFVKPWYKIYKPAYEPLLLTAFDDKENLIGLLCLAIDRITKEIVAAGAEQCEYQTWLALDEYGDSFIEKAMDILAETFPNKSLCFLSLAQGSPLKWLEAGAKWSKQTHLKDSALPLLRIGDGSYIEQSLRKKANRSRLNQMKRDAEVEFVQLHQTEEFEKIFDEVKLYSTLRLSAVHRVAPNPEPFKKTFYVELLKAGLLHVTLLKIGGKIASAHFNLHNRNQVLLGMVTLSPFFAKFSPGKFHIFFLCQKLLKQGISTFDLTPGGYYKDRFANDFENVHVLTVFFNRSDYLLYKTKRRVINVSKEMLKKININREWLESKQELFSNKIKYFTPGKAAKTAFSIIKRNLYERREMRIYIYDVKKIPSLPEKNLMNRNCLEDLLKYQQAESYQPTISQFHREALKRIEEGQIIYTRVENDVLVHYGWLAERVEKSFITEVGQEITLLPNSSSLYDFYSHPLARGKGLYQASLSQMLHDVMAIPNTERAYITVLADNKPSRYVIEKVGFEYQFSLRRSKTFGIVRKE